MVFDTASLYFRAFFGLPSTLRASDGRPVNAVRGLLDFMAKFADLYRPTHIACAWDQDWRPQWRVDLIPTYKQHRVVVGSEAEEIPEALSNQVPLIRDVLNALGIEIIGKSGYEADDVAATLAARFEGEALVVSGDRDLFGLVTESVKVVYIGAGISAYSLVDQEWVMKKFGVPAWHYVDYLVMRGDPSDGLPGIKGIGEKTAASLIAGFGSLDEIIKAASDPSSAMAPGPRSKILAGLDYLGPARKVVQTVSDLDLPELAPFNPKLADLASFKSLSRELNLGSSGVRILNALGIEN